MQEHAHAFTANYTDGTVHLAGRRFPAGYFVAEALNACTEIDLSEQSGAWEQLLLSAMQSGQVNKTLFTKAKADVYALWDRIHAVPPFSLICDVQTEREMLDNAFDEQHIDSYRAISTTPPVLEPVDENGNKISDAAYRGYRDLRALLPFYMVLIADWEALDCLYKEWSNESVIMRHPSKQELLALAAKYADEMGAQHRRVVCRVGAPSAQMRFSDYRSFILTDFLEGIHHGHYPKRCVNCGRWFLITDGIHRKYCDGIDPYDAKQRPCRKVAASRRAKESAATHPVKTLCAARLATIRKHKERQKLSEQEAQAAKRYAVNCRDRAIMDNDYANGQYSADMELTAIYTAIEKGGA